MSKDLNHDLNKIEYQQKFNFVMSMNRTVELKFLLVNFSVERDRQMKLDMILFSVKILTNNHKSNKTHRKTDLLIVSLQNWEIAKISDPMSKVFKTQPKEVISYYNSTKRPPEYHVQPWSLLHVFDSRNRAKPNIAPSFICWFFSKGQVLRLQPLLWKTLSLQLYQYRTAFATTTTTAKTLSFSNQLIHMQRHRQLRHENQRITIQLQQSAKSRDCNDLDIPFWTVNLKLELSP